MLTARYICCRGSAARATAAALLIAALLIPSTSIGLVVYDRVFIEICFDGRDAEYKIYGWIHLVNETYDEVYTEGFFNASQGVLRITGVMIRYSGLRYEGYLDIILSRVGEAVHIMLKRYNESRGTPWSYTRENYTGVLEPAPGGYVLYANISLITTSNDIIGELNSTIAYLEIVSPLGASVIDYSVAGGRNNSMYIANVAINGLRMQAAALSSPLLAYYLGLPPGLGVNTASFLRTTKSLRLREEWAGINHRYSLMVRARNISMFTENIYLYPRSRAVYAALRVSWGHVSFINGKWVYRAPIEAPIDGRVPGFLNASLRAVVRGETINERYSNLIREIKMLVSAFPATLRLEACTGWLLYRGARTTRIHVARGNVSVLDDTEYVYRGKGGVGVSLLAMILAAMAIAGAAVAAYFLIPTRLRRGSE